MVYHKQCLDALQGAVEALPKLGNACANTAMKSGKELGQAIRGAIALLGNQTALAAHLGISPAAVSQMLNTGRISKRHLPGLVAYFRTVVGPEHWGLPATWGDDGAGLSTEAVMLGQELDAIRNVDAKRVALAQCLLLLGKAQGTEPGRPAIAPPVEPIAPPAPRQQTRGERSQT